MRRQLLDVFGARRDHRVGIFPCREQSFGNFRVSSLCLTKPASPRAPPSQFEGQKREVPVYAWKAAAHKMSSASAMLNNLQGFLCGEGRDGDRHATGHRGPSGSASICSNSAGARARALWGGARAGLVDGGVVLGLDAAHHGQNLLRRRVPDLPRTQPPVQVLGPHAPGGVRAIQPTAKRRRASLPDGAPADAAGSPCTLQQPSIGKGPPKSRPRDGALGFRRPCQLHNRPPQKHTNLRTRGRRIPRNPGWAPLEISTLAADPRRRDTKVPINARDVALRRPQWPQSSAGPWRRSRRSCARMRRAAYSQPAPVAQEPQGRRNCCATPNNIFLSPPLAEPTTLMFASAKRLALRTCNSSAAK